eukprot:Hpha_TRINITY_DN15776_c2_g4::TRINITY_DN15776_c2_g4_i1::g.38689::m.38689
MIDSGQGQRHSAPSPLLLGEIRTPNGIRQTPGQSTRTSSRSPSGTRDWPLPHAAAVGGAPLGDAPRRGSHSPSGSRSQRGGKRGQPLRQAPRKQIILAPSSGWQVPNTMPGRWRRVGAAAVHTGRNTPRSGVVSRRNAQCTGTYSNPLPVPWRYGSASSGQIPRPSAPRRGTSPPASLRTSREVPPRRGSASSSRPLRSRSASVAVRCEATASRARASTPPPSTRDFVRSPEYRRPPPPPRHLQSPPRPPEATTSSLQNAFDSEDQLEPLSPCLAADDESNDRNLSIRTEPTSKEWKSQKVTSGSGRMDLTRSLNTTLEAEGDEGFEEGDAVELSPRGMNVNMYNWEGDPVRPGEVGQVVGDSEGRVMMRDQTDGLQVHVEGPRGDSDWYSVGDLRKVNQPSPRAAPEPRCAGLGDLVISRYGQHLDDPAPGHWRLGPHEVAQVVDIDAEGDVRLCNAAGDVSSFWKYATLLRTVDGAYLVRRDRRNSTFSESTKDFACTSTSVQIVYSSLDLKEEDSARVDPASPITIAGTSFQTMPQGHGAGAHHIRSTPSTPATSTFTPS